MLSLRPNVDAEYARTILTPVAAAQMMRADVDGVRCEVDGGSVVLSFLLDGKRVSFPLVTPGELRDGTWRKRQIVRMGVLAAGLRAIKVADAAAGDITSAPELWRLMGPAESFQGEEAD